MGRDEYKICEKRFHVIEVILYGVDRDGNHNFPILSYDFNTRFYLFRYAAYRARNLLAMIDYQEHKDRPLALDKDGEPR